MGKKLVFTPMSKKLAYFRDHVMKFVFQNNCVPLNPFVVGYFLLDTVPRETIYEANFALVERADEIWVFGNISDGVIAEIKLGKKLNKPIRYFKVIDNKEIREITREEVEFEDDVKESHSDL